MQKRNSPPGTSWPRRLVHWPHVLKPAPPAGCLSTRAVPSRSKNRIIRPPIAILSCRTIHLSSTAASHRRQLSPRHRFRSTRRISCPCAHLSRHQHLRARRASISNSAPNHVSFAAGVVCGPLHVLGISGQPPHAAESRLERCMRELFL